MSLTDRFTRLVSGPDHERIRTELLLARFIEYGKDELEQVGADNV